MLMARKSRKELSPLLRAYLFKQRFVTSDKRLELKRFLLTSKSVTFFLTKTPEPPISSSKYSQHAMREFWVYKQWWWLPVGEVVRKPTWEYLPGRLPRHRGFRARITSLTGQRIMVYRLFTQHVITSFSKRREGKKKSKGVWSLAKV